MRTFGERVISRNDPVNSPNRSCDLTHLDIFLWGYVKSLVYVNKPTTLENSEITLHATLRSFSPKGVIVSNARSFLLFEV